MKKIAALLVTGLLIANSFYGQQKTIQVLCKNRITVEETKYQSGKIVETIIKDYGYSAMNQQLLNFVDIRLSELNFLVSMRESDKCDYTLTIDSLCTDLGSWNSTYVILKDNINNKKYKSFIYNNFTTQSLPDQTSLKIVTFITDKLAKDMLKIIFYNAQLDDGLYISSSSDTPIRIGDTKLTKIIRNINKDEAFEILEIALNDNKLNREEPYPLRIKTKDNTIGWVNSSILLLK